MLEMFRSRRRHSLEEHDPQPRRVAAMSTAAVEYRLSIMAGQPFKGDDIPYRARRLKLLAHQLLTGRISDQEPSS